MSSDIRGIANGEVQKAITAKETPNHDSPPISFTVSQAAAILEQAKVDDNVIRKGTLLRAVQNDIDEKRAIRIRGIKI